MSYSQSNGLGFTFDPSLSINIDASKSGEAKGTVVRRGAESEPPSEKEIRLALARARDKTNAKFFVLSSTHSDTKPIFDALGMSPRQITTEKGERIVYDRSELPPDTRVSTLEGEQTRLKDLPDNKDLVFVSRDGIRAIEYTLTFGYPPPVSPWYAQKWGPLPAWAWLGGGTAVLLGAVWSMRR